MISSGSILVVASMLFSLTLLPLATPKTKTAPQAAATSSYQLDYSQTSIGAVAASSDSYASEDCMVAGTLIPQIQESASYSSTNTMDPGVATLPSRANNNWTQY